MARIEAVTWIMLLWLVPLASARAAINLGKVTLKPDPPEAGDNILELVVTDGSGAALAPANLTMTVIMPAMGSMAQMQVKPSLSTAGGGAGVVRAEFSLPMAGSWDVTLTAKTASEARTFLGTLTTGIAGINWHNAAPAAPSAAAPASAGEAAAPSLVLGPERLQKIGVRWVEAKVQPLTKTLRAAGLVQADDTRKGEVTLRFSGYVESQLRGRVGDHVEAGAPLMTVYSPELMAAETEFFLAHGGGAAPPAASEVLHLSTRERLKSFGLSEADLNRLRQKGSPERALTIRAPQTGTILEVNVREGSAFSAGQALYTIGDLRRTFIVGRVFQKDLAELKAGQKLRIIATDGGEAEGEGQVEVIFPDVTEGTGIGSVRVVPLTPLPGLRPGAFVDLRFSIDLGAHLVVPTSAVLFSGLQRYVFVDKGEGRLEPRAVTVGKNTEDFTAITQGLQAGERVAASGTFLLGSEAQLRSALPKWTPR